MTRRLSLASCLALAAALICVGASAANVVRSKPEMVAGQRDRAVAALGARLFQDPLLSASGGTACSSCHIPSLAFADGRAKSVGDGAGQTLRNTPSLLSAANRTRFFWDGAEKDLETAVQRPLFDPLEMGNASAVALLANIRSAEGYEPAFERAFGSPGISLPRIGRAIAAYLRLEALSRDAGQADAKGKVPTPEQLAGRRIFEGKAGCSTCHAGVPLTDDLFHNTGLASPGEAGTDVGRFAVTGDTRDAGRFRTPSLLAVGATAPYMHNGAFSDLDMVVRFYERGGGSPWVRNRAEENDPVALNMASVSPLLQPFRLEAAERKALIAFLEGL